MPEFVAVMVVVPMPRSVTTLFEIDPIAPLSIKQGYSDFVCVSNRRPWS